MIATEATVRPRTLVLRMDAATQELLKSVLGIGGSLLGGAVGMDLLKRWFARKKKKESEPIEFTARILDDGDTLRHLLLEESRRLRIEKDAAAERAHQAEIQVAVATRDIHQLQGRLDRKDEQCKALQSQIINLGATPVHLTAPSGRAVT